MRDETNSRRSLRYQFVLPVLYQTLGTSSSKSGSGWTRNVSETGTCLELTESLARGTALSLVLRIEGDSLALQAEVAWVGHPSLPSGGTLHGATFSQTTQDQRQGLQVLLQQATRVPSRRDRIPIALLARCHAIGAPETPLSGWTGDLGQDGCSLVLPDRLPVGTLIEVTLTMPHGDFTAEATVVWVGPSARRQLTHHGVYFRGPNLPRDLISRFVSESGSKGLRRDPHPE